MRNHRRHRSASHGATDLLEPEVDETGDDQSARFINALDRSQAIIEFEPDGTIIRANHNFLAAMGYLAHEVEGAHHRIFMDPVEAKSDQYARFWERLGAGEHHTAEFRRVKKDGSDIWIQATYYPVTDESGRVERVVKVASDVTEQREARRAIINRSQAVVDFLPDGTLLEANDLFCQTVGYRLGEIVGQCLCVGLDGEFAHAVRTRAGTGNKAVDRTDGHGAPAALFQHRQECQVNAVWAEDIDVMYPGDVVCRDFRHASDTGDTRIVHDAPQTPSFTGDQLRGRIGRGGHAER